jgi:hypothetical protein
MFDVGLSIPQGYLRARIKSKQAKRQTPLCVGFGGDRASALAGVVVMYAGSNLPDETGEIEYQRSRSNSVDVDEAGIDDKRLVRPAKK